MSPSDLYIPVIQGTDRGKRQSIHAARYIAKFGAQLDGVTTELVDPLQFDFAFDGNDAENKDPLYSQITTRADAFFLIIPEYNHSFPGSLKTLLDTELQNYQHKPVAFAGVSAGPWGGIRAIESMVPTVREMGLIASSIDVQFPLIQNIFAEDGTLQDSTYEKRVKRAFDELLWLARVLKQGREQE